MARLGFWGVLFTLPMRYRIAWVERAVPPVYYEYTDFSLYWSDVFLLFTIVFWGLSLIVQPRKLEFGPLFIWLPLSGLTLWSGLSIPFSVDSWFSAYNFLRLILLFALYLYLVNELVSERLSLERMMIPIGAQIAVQSFVGIAQGLRQRSIGWASLGEHTLTPQARGVSVVTANGMRWLRAYGLTDHPNILGGSLCIALVLLMTVILQREGKDRWQMISGVLVFLAGGAALFLSFSRSAWIAWILATGWFGVALLRSSHRPRLKRYVLLITLAGAMLIPFFLGYQSVLQNRLSEVAETSASTYPPASVAHRVLLIGAAIKLLANNLITGVGLSAFPIALLREFPQFPIHYQPVHVVLLDAAAETGVIGGAIFSFLLAAPWAALFVRGRGRRVTSSPLSRASKRFDLPMMGASAALLAISVIGFFDYYPWMLAPGRLWQWLIWGLWAGFWGANSREARHV